MVRTPSRGSQSNRAPGGPSMGVSWASVERLHRSSLSRRQVLHGGGAALGAMALSGLAGCAGDEASAPPTRRLAITMWEFSWLVRRIAPEAEYSDWDTVLDELADRGYDCIRLDAFPHLIAAGPDGARVERFTIAPRAPLFFWGNHAPVEVEPRPALAEFLRKARARGMRVGLSTWFCDDSLGRAETVVTPADLARVWLETLDFLADQRLLDGVEWVDLCNEFPLPSWARGAYPAIFGAPITNPLPVLLPWSGAATARIQSYLDEGIGPLREAYPELRYTFSVEGGTVGPKFRNLDTRSLDLAEIHIWLSNDLDFLLRSGQLFLLLGLPGSLALHTSTAPGLYFGDREHWLTTLRGLMDGWSAWSRERGLPLLTTEAWGPINYDDVPSLEDASEWDWVKDVCREGVTAAIERGWAGICTSNFAQPHFEGPWSDVAWHRELTRRIRAG